MSINDVRSALTTAEQKKTHIFKMPKGGTLSELAMALLEKKEQHAISNSDPKIKTIVTELQETTKPRIQKPDFVLAGQEFDLSRYFDNPVKPTLEKSSLFSWLFAFFSKPAGAPSALDKPLDAAKTTTPQPPLAPQRPEFNLLEGFFDKFFPKQPAVIPLAMPSASTPYTETVNLAALPTFNLNDTPSFNARDKTWGSHAQKVLPAIMKYAEQFDIPLPVALAVTETETHVGKICGNPNRGNDGLQNGIGPYQVKNVAVRDLLIKHPEWFNDIFIVENINSDRLKTDTKYLKQCAATLNQNTDYNICFGIAYLKHLKGNDTSPEWRGVYGKYNKGPGGYQIFRQHNPGSYPTYAEKTQKYERYYEKLEPVIKNQPNAPQLPWATAP